MTVTIPANAEVYIATDGGAGTQSISPTGFSSVDIVLFIDGAVVPSGAYQRHIVVNNGGIVGVFGYWSMSQSIALTAGTHTIAVQAAGTGIGSNATVSGDTTSVIQGELTVLILKK
jgi:hypothetical protein